MKDTNGHKASVWQTGQKSSVDERRVSEKSSVDRKVVYRLYARQVVFTRRDVVLTLGKAVWRQSSIAIEECWH